MDAHRNLVLSEALKLPPNTSHLLLGSENGMLAVDNLRRALADLQTAYELIEQVRDLAQSHTSTLAKDI